MIEYCDDVFAKPHQFPPSKAGFDHTIPFKEGVEAFKFKTLHVFFYA